MRARTVRLIAVMCLVFAVIGGLCYEGIAQIRRAPGSLERGKNTRVGQSRRSRGGDSRRPIVISDIDGLGSEGLVQAPEYSFKGYASESGRVRPWGRVRCTYQTKPDWIDELVFTYHVLLKADDPDDV